MDNCNKAIAFVALIYTIGNQLRQSPIIVASAQQWQALDRSPGNQPNELIKRPDWDRAPKPMKGNLMRPLMAQDDPDGESFNFWRDLEAQLFIAQLFNLTKLRLADKEASDSLSKLTDSNNKCAEFNKSMDVAQMGLVKLLKLTNLERLHQFELIRRASKRINLFEDSLAMQEISFDKRRQAMQTLNDLGITVVLFSHCLSSLTLQLNQDDPLLEDMVQLGDYMRTLGVQVERAASNHDKSFAYLIPESIDMSLNSLAEGQLDDSRHRSATFVDKLKVAFAELKTEMETGAKNLKRFLGLDDDDDDDNNAIRMAQTNS